MCSSIRWLTESPRWLITTNKLEEATKALTRVAHINGKKNAGKILTTEVIWGGDLVIGTNMPQIHKLPSWAPARTQDKIRILWMEYYSSPDSPWILHLSEVIQDNA